MSASRCSACSIRSLAASSPSEVLEEEEEEEAEEKERDTGDDSNLASALMATESSCSPQSPLEVCQEYIAGATECPPSPFCSSLFEPGSVCIDFLEEDRSEGGSDEGGAGVGEAAPVDPKRHGPPRAFMDRDPTPPQPSLEPPPPVEIS